MIWTEDLNDVGKLLLHENIASIVEVPTWQALDVRDKPQGRTIEVCDLTHTMQIPSTRLDLEKEVQPNMPWAEEQFKERVGGEPLNPGLTYLRWPWYKGNVEGHKPQGRFSHTYMARYWGRSGDVLTRSGSWRKLSGQYGDLNDVVSLLAREPTTRQAYLPVFWPEDTGAVHGQRIPCSLGYLFLLRDYKLNITYYIRSCDFYRHFRDDVYMTARLCQWVLDEIVTSKMSTADGSFNHHNWEQVEPGRLTMHIGSLHVFEGDLPKLRREYG